MRPILVAGTGSWKHDGATDWYCPSSNFGRFLEAHDAPPIYDGNQPFIWSTDLAGVPWFTNVKDWAAGGAALFYFVAVQQQIPGFKTAIIAHSHALQVAAFAAADHNLKIDTLVTVGSPIRADLAKQYGALKANTRYWLHIHSDESDRWQWLGELFDRINPFAWRVQRECPLADRNDSVPKVGHSALLRDPLQYHYWIERGWLKLVAQPLEAA